MLDIIYNDGKLSSQNINFSSLKNKKILITGATGLIGLHILSILKAAQLDYNIKIFCWVTGPIDPKISAIFDNCELLVGDLTNINQYIEINFNKQFDLIIHSAGYAQPQKFTGNKINTIQLNTSAIVGLFKLLKDKGTFVFCSTSEIYSGLIKENIFEQEIGSTTPEHPRACYIESKRCGETICHAFAERGYSVKIARISLAYGPGARANDTRVMQNIIDKAITENKIELLDSGSSIRTYCYVSDIAEMLWNISLHGKESVYNIAGISKITIKELAQNVAKKLDCELIIPNDNKFGLSGNPTLVNVNIEKYVKEFNKLQFTNFDDGLKKTIAWQKYILK